MDKGPNTFMPLRGGLAEVQPGRGSGTQGAGMERTLPQIQMHIGGDRMVPCSRVAKPACNGAQALGGRCACTPFPFWSRKYFGNYQFLVQVDEFGFPEARVDTAEMNDQMKHTRTHLFKNMQHVHP